MSVWRTYLVANEWNEIQTLRKTKIGLQVVVFLVFMKVGRIDTQKKRFHNDLRKVGKMYK